MSSRLITDYVGVNICVGLLGLTKLILIQFKFISECRLPLLLTRAADTSTAQICASIFKAASAVQTEVRRLIHCGHRRPAYPCPSGIRNWVFLEGFFEALIEAVQLQSIKFIKLSSSGAGEAAAGPRDADAVGGGNSSKRAQLPLPHGLHPQHRRLQ